MIDQYRPDHDVPCPNAPPGRGGDHCACWEDCEPCCTCGDHPACPADEQGTCADCGRELDEDGHPVDTDHVRTHAREALVRPR